MRKSTHRKANTSGEWSLTIHQLWMQLPPEWEESDVEYTNIYPDELPIVDNVKVIAGSFNEYESPLKTPYDLTYLDVILESGESFAFDTPPGQTTGFVFPRSGSLRLHGDEVPGHRLSILENNEGHLEFTAEAKTKFVLLLAAPQDHPIVSHGGSIHTNVESLERSFERIKRIGETRQLV